MRQNKHFFFSLFSLANWFFYRSKFIRRKLLREVFFQTEFLLKNWFRVDIDFLWKVRWKIVAREREKERKVLINFPQVLENLIEKGFQKLWYRHKSCVMEITLKGVFLLARFCFIPLFYHFLFNGQREMSDYCRGRHGLNRLLQAEVIRCDINAHPTCINLAFQYSTLIKIQSTEPSRKWNYNFHVCILKSKKCKILLRMMFSQGDICWTRWFSFSFSLFFQ